MVATDQESLSKFGFECCEETHDQSSSYKGRHVSWLTGSEVPSVLIMYGSMQADGAGEGAEKPTS